VLDQVDEPSTDLDRATYIAPDDPVAGTASLRSAAASMPPSLPADDPGGFPTDGGSRLTPGGATGRPPADGPDDVIQAPIVKHEHEKLGRNEPCWCGSGKKFKLCHGR
jgi:hypothetical protein